MRAQPLETPDKLSFDESVKRMAGADEISCRAISGPIFRRFLFADRYAAPLDNLRT
jgi:hypothetical protein